MKQIAVGSGEARSARLKPVDVDQALETEMGGVQVYTPALRCVVNEDLKEEWKEYLEQTKRHVNRSCRGAVLCSLIGY
ncbi:MAG: hypothetical protein WAV47_04195 [Blastocatellia bacterium]